MSPLKSESTSRVSHVVAMPYPGRGHINPMMNLCKSLVSTADHVFITFVVTEEWQGFIGSEPSPETIRLASLPNVIPSEQVRGADIDGFIEAVMTKLEAPFELLLDRLELPVTLIMADSLLFWAVGVGNRKNIPVASFWPMSAMTFSMHKHFNLLVQNGHYPVDSLEMGKERVDYIPGVSSTRLMDFPSSIINVRKPHLLQFFYNIMSWVSKSQYLLVASIYELEPRTIDALRVKLSSSVYTIGPAIPYFKFGNDYSLSLGHNEPNYIQWLNHQPESSVLYVSFGSFHSISGAQMDEIAAGLRDSGVRFLWVVRGEINKLKEACANGKGLLLPWCDQLRVLSHPCIGGFLTHCGWNSVQEGVFSGVPFLTFPVGMDQTTNSKLIEEDWKVGWRVRKEVRVENLVTRDEIMELVKKFMDLESNEVKEMRRRVKELQNICQHAILQDGSSQVNIESFIREVSQCSVY